MLFILPFQESLDELLDSVGLLQTPKHFFNMILDRRGKLLAAVLSEHGGHLRDHLLFGHTIDRTLDAVGFVCVQMPLQGDEGRSASEGA